MEFEALTTLLGVALAALVAACGAGFLWMRTGFRDLRNRVDTQFQDRTETTNAQFAEVNGRLARLEAKFDDLIMALARAGSLVDPQPAPPPRPPPVSESNASAQSPESAPTPNESPDQRPLPSKAASEIADPPRAPPTVGDRPSAEQPFRSPPADPLGPMAAPA
jgi:hypothetical protein